MINYKLKIGSKILVCESRPIVFLHEINYVRLYPVWALPEAPKPLGAEAWHSIYAKVDKDAHLGLVIPLQHKCFIVDLQNITKPERQSFVSSLPLEEVLHPSFSMLAHTSQSHEQVERKM